MIGTGIGGVKDSHRTLAFEWQNSGGHLVKDDAERKKIGPPVEFFTEELLGGHVDDGA
jgi:hypothetical protein